MWLAKRKIPVNVHICQDLKDRINDNNNMARMKAGGSQTGVLIISQDMLCKSFGRSVGSMPLLPPSSKLNKFNWQPWVRKLLPFIILPFCNKDFALQMIGIQFQTLRLVACTMLLKKKTWKTLATLLYPTCSGGTWQNNDTLSLTELETGCLHRHMTWNLDWISVHMMSTLS